MPTFRISLVEIFTAEEGEDTPFPFLEVRTFMFLPEYPEGLRLQSIRNSLKGWIETIKREFLGHIFESERNDLESKTDTEKAMFKEVRKATLGSRLVIEGLEISEMDSDELIDRHFKQERKRGKLNLLERTPYLYVAFYKKGKAKPVEYDDIDIKKAIGRSFELRAERERLFRKARGLVEDIEQKTVQLHGAIGEMEKSLKAFSRRG